MTPDHWSVEKRYVRPGRGPVRLDGGPEAPSSDWLRYVIAVTRHKWIVLITVLIGTGLGVVGTRLIDPQFATQAILWVETSGRERDLSAADGLIEGGGWTELIRSNAVLEPVVRDLRLYLEPESARDSTALTTLEVVGDARPGRYRLRIDGAGDHYQLAQDGVTVEAGAVGDTIGRDHGLRWIPVAEALSTARDVEFTLTTPYDAARRLARNLEVKLDPGGTFLRVGLQAPDPERAAAIVNAVGRRAVTVAADLKRQKFEELTSILSSQFEHARATLRAAEAALSDFRVRTAARLRNDAPAVTPKLDARDDPIFARAFDLRVTVEELQRDREAIERAMAGAEDGRLSLDALAVIGAVRESPELSLALEEVSQKRAEVRALRYRYTDESAPVRESVDDLETLERRTVPALAGHLARQLAAREDALRPEVDAAYQYLRDVPPLAVEELRLEREAANAEDLFTTVRQRYEATRLGLVSALPDLRILDRAVAPQHPVRDLSILVLLLSLVMSLGLGIVGATAFERIDSKVRYPEQVTHGLRLGILGAVPRAGLPAAKNGRAPDINVIEALRGLRLRVIHSYGSAGPMILTVTSPGAGEGKSFVSANLALSFGHAGYRTLLVDGDVRRGRQHRLLDRPHQPGLTDVLTGESALEAAIRDTDYPGLSFLSSGTRMERAPELLQSHDLPTLMTRLRAMYDVVIVDSPPLGAGVDPLILATATGTALLVLRTGSSDLPLTTTKLDVLDSLPVRTIGVVLNDVRETSAFRYYTYDVTAHRQRTGGAAPVRRDGRPHLLGEPV